MVCIIVSREIVFLGDSRLITPERLFCTPGEVIFKIVPYLKVDSYLRHELMCPVACWIALHKCNRVVLLVI